MDQRRAAGVARRCEDGGERRDGCNATLSEETRHDFIRGVRNQPSVVMERCSTGRPSSRYVVVGRAVATPRPAAQRRDSDESPVGGASRSAEAARRLSGRASEADARRQCTDGVPRESDRRSLCEHGTTAGANGGGLLLAGLQRTTADRASTIGISWSKQRARPTAALASATAPRSC